MPIPTLRTITIPDQYSWETYDLVDAGDQVAVGSFGSWDAANDARNKWHMRDPKVRSYIERVTTWSQDGLAREFRERMR
jgi:hypothetical protein